MSLAQPAAAAPSLRIAEVRSYLLDKAIFVEIVTGSGVTGWGECSSDNRRLMKTFIHNGLEEHLIGRDPFDTEPLWDLMFFKNHDLGPSGALLNAMAGVDIALWDVKARALGLPLYKLLGGQYRDRVRAYGSFGVGGGRSMTTGEAARQAAKFVETGFTVVKLRMQIRENNLNPEPDPTLRYVAAVRQAIGDDVELVVDINNGYTASRAIEVGRRLREEFGVRYLEDPVSDQNDREMAQVVEALDLHIIAGEKEYTRWQIADLVTRGNVDFINPDVIKAGGLTEMKKIAAVAQTFHKPIIAHNTRPTISTAATLHFLASIPNCGPFVETPDLDRFADLLALMKNNVRLEDGFLLVPEGIGLGIEPDEEAIRRAVIA